MGGPELTEGQPNSLSALAGDTQVTCGTMLVSPLFKDRHLKPQFCPHHTFLKTSIPIQLAFGDRTE